MRSNISLAAAILYRTKMEIFEMLVANSCCNEIMPLWQHTHTQTHADIRTFHNNGTFIAKYFNHKTTTISHFTPGGRRHVA